MHVSCDDKKKHALCQYGLLVWDTVMWLNRSNTSRRNSESIEPTPSTPITETSPWNWTSIWQHFSLKCGFPLINWVAFRLVFLNEWILITSGYFTGKFQNPKYVKFKRLKSAAFSTEWTTLEYQKKNWMENFMEKYAWEDHGWGGNTTSGGNDRCCWL